MKSGGVVPVACEGAEGKNASGECVQLLCIPTLFAEFLMSKKYI